MRRKVGFASMMTEPIGDKVRFCDRSRDYCDSKSPERDLEAYWVGLLERVKRESESISSKGEYTLETSTTVDSVERRTSRRETGDQIVL